MKLVLYLVAVFTVQALAQPSNAKTTVEKLVSEEDVAVALAKYTASLSKSMREKASFSVVLSGGSLINTLRYYYIICLQFRTK